MNSTTWERLGQVCTAESIMTPRVDLLTWERGTDREAVRAEAEARAIDLVPVTTGGRVDGVWNRLAAGEPEPLYPGWVVPGKTSLPDLLDLLAEAKRPGLVVLRETEVIGVVTPADLNKIAARAFVHQLVGGLEGALAAVLAREFEGKLDEMKSLLSPARRKALADQERKARAGDVIIDVTQMLYLPDLLDIVSESRALRTLLGFGSAKEAKQLYSGLVDLRMRTMHPLRSLLEYQHELPRVHSWIRRALDALMLLEKALEAETGWS
jgi:hypothetical protein